MGSAARGEVMPSFESQLIAEARRVARAQNKCKRLRKELKLAAQELRQAKRDLKKLSDAARDPFNQSPPLREFGE